MSLWFRIGQRQFYQDAGAVPFMNPKLAAHLLLTDAGQLKATTGNENASMTLTLKNANGECRDLFAAPPLGQLVPVFDNATQIFEGRLTQIDLSTDCKVQVQA